MKSEKKILVVDDESVGRQLLEAILISEGYTIIFAENGQIAYDIACTQFPDVILCDVMMPIMDGFEVCKKIRSNSATAHMPIFLITALDDRDSRIKGIDAGADDYISKPLDRLEIMAKVRNATLLLEVRKNTNFSPNTNEIVAEHAAKMPYYNCILSNILDNDYHINRKHRQLYRLKPIFDSKHTIQFRQHGKKELTWLISNTLNEEFAPMYNALVSQLIEGVIAEFSDSPSKIIVQVIQLVDHMASVYKFDNSQFTNLSIVIVVNDTVEKYSVISGINTICFVAGGESLLYTSTSIKTYQPFFLLGHQDIQIKNPDIICLLSGNIQNTMPLPVIQNFLNTNFHNNHQSSHQNLLKDFFISDQDILLYKFDFNPA